MAAVETVFTGGIRLPHLLVTPRAKPPLPSPSRDQAVLRSLPDQDWKPFPHRGHTYIWLSDCNIRTYLQRRGVWHLLLRTPTLGSRVYRETPNRLRWSKT